MTLACTGALVENESDFLPCYIEELADAFEQWRNAKALIGYLRSATTPPQPPQPEAVHRQLHHPYISTHSSPPLAEDVRPAYIILMPAYFFHLAFELYPSRSSPDTTFTPPPQTDIFTSELPAHNTTSWSALVPSQRTFSKLRKPVASSSDLTHLSGSRERPSNSRRYSQRSRLSFSEHHDSPVPIVKPPTRPPHKRAQSFAHKDWRFDTISILSIDMKTSDGDNSSRARAKTLKQPATSSGGLATKGKFIPSDPKDTEVGWGVVHLYRDGQETPGLYDDGASVEFNEEDCSTLCILAVPSYMTPADLLGFIGEQTREDVSHFRLIRTTRANKYMVLMKFRESKRAREWRKDWNGKAFNSMEVCATSTTSGRLESKANISKARILSCRLCQVYNLPIRLFQPRSVFLPRSY